MSNRLLMVTARLTCGASSLNVAISPSVGRPAAAVRPKLSTPIIAGSRTRAIATWSTQPCAALQSR
jgi:hypothetical protein